MDQTDQTSDIDLPETSPRPAPSFEPPKEKSKRSKSLVVAWVLVGLLAVGAGVFAWLYFNQGPDAEAPVTEDTSQSTATDTTPDETAAPVKTVYEAEVGKFSLEMDPSYVVIERLDGPFEGGPATTVDIGEQVEDRPGVVQTNPAQAFTIFARPEEGATLANNSRTFAIEGDELAERQADGQFAETTARIYQVDGLFSVTHIILVKNGIVYEITQLTEDSTHSSIYQVVEAGFTFVE